MKQNVKWIWLAAFTAVFAVLAAYVFWGTWSPNVAPVMPDDGIWHPLKMSEQFRGWFRNWLKSGTFTPMDVFWSGIVVSKYWFQEFKYVTGLYFSALGLVLFLRGRSLPRVAAYGAGLLLAFCGYWCTLFSAGHGGWFLQISVIVPALAFMDRAVCGGRFRDWVLLGACVGWGTCQQQDLFLLFALLVAAYGVYACCRERKFPWQGALVALAMTGVVGGAGIRTAFKDALSGRDRQIEESKGTSLAGGKGQVAENASAEEKAKADAEARWIFVTNWSMPPEDTLEFFRSRIHGDTSCPMTLQLGRAAGRDVKPYTGRLGRPLDAKQGNYRQHSLYVGWITCLLALLGVGSAFAGRRNSDVLFFALAALFCWLCSMGRYCEPVYRLVYLLPFGDSLRAPVKWHHVTEFCLCLLSGYGLAFLHRLIRAKFFAGTEWKAGLLVAAVAIVGAADLAHVDRLYCAPIDLTVVRSRNSAAEEILKRGKGTVCDLIEGGNGLLAWSFNANGLGMTRDLNAANVRFVWVGSEQVRRTPQLAAWLKQKTVPVGSYAVTQSGIRATAPESGNASLYQVNGVPPPPPPSAPSVDWTVLALGILSLLGTAFAAGCLFCRKSRL